MKDLTTRKQVDINGTFEEVLKEQMKEKEVIEDVIPVGNLDLWDRVQETNPNYTKKAKVGGNQITSIAPQFQVMNATEQFGVYGSTWGFKNIDFDYSITNTPITLKITDWNTKEVEDINTILGIVGFKATFFFPEGEFVITNSIKIFTDNKHSKIDDQFAKKLETDALTKALSKLGFNADIFLGRFDDSRYFNEVNEKYNPKPKKTISDIDFNRGVEKMEVTAFKKLMQGYELTDTQTAILKAL